MQTPQEYLIYEAGGDGNVVCGSVENQTGVKWQVHQLKQQGDIQQANEIVRKNAACFRPTKHWEQLTGPKFKDIENMTQGTSAHSDFCRAVRHNYGQAKKHGFSQYAQHLKNEYPDCEPELGYNPPNPELDVQPGSLNFGPVKQGITKTKTIRLRNSGNSPLEIKNYSITGPHQQLFEIVAGSSPTLQPNEGINFDIQFEPKSIGQKTATFTIHTNDNQSPMLVSLDGGKEPDEDDENEIQADTDPQPDNNVPDVEPNDPPQKQDCKKTFDDCIPEVVREFEQDAERTAKAFEKNRELSSDPKDQLIQTIDDRLSGLNDCLKDEAQSDRSDERSIDPIEGAKETARDSLNPLERFADNKLGSIRDLLSDPTSNQSDPIEDLKILSGVAQGLFPGMRAVKALEQADRAERQIETVQQEIIKTKEKMDKAPGIAEELIGHNPQDEQELIDRVRESIASARECIERSEQEATEIRRENPDFFKPRNEYGEPVDDASEVDIEETVLQARQNPSFNNIADVIEDGRNALNREPNRSADQIENLMQSINEVMDALNEARRNIQNLIQNLKSLAKEVVPDISKLAESANTIDERLEDLENVLERFGPDRKKSMRSQMRDVEQNVRAIGNAVDNTLGQACDEIGNVGDVGQAINTAIGMIDDTAQEITSNATDAVWTSINEIHGQLMSEWERIKGKGGPIGHEDVIGLMSELSGVREEFNTFESLFDQMDFPAVKNELTSVFNDQEELEKTKKVWDQLKGHGGQMGGSIEKKMNGSINGLWGLKEETDECTRALEVCLQDQIRNQSENTTDMLDKNRIAEKLRRQNERKKAKMQKGSRQKKQAQASMETFFKNLKELGGNLRRLREGMD